MGIGKSINRWLSKKGPETGATKDLPDRIEEGFTPEDSEVKGETEDSYGVQVDRPEGVLQPVSSLVPESDDHVERDMFKDIFNGMSMVKESPVGMLIASLPDVSMDELLEEARSLKVLIRNWRQE